MSMAGCYAIAMKPDTICGVNAVTALFARRPDDVLRLFYLAERCDLAGPWCAGLAAARRPYRLVPPDEMAKVAGTPHHGGIAAVAKPRVIDFLDFLAPPRLPFLLVLDGIGNPHNLGAIARSAAFFGVRGLLIHEMPGAALPSDAAYRTAEGGLEFLSLWRTRNLPHALAALTPHYRTVAASLSGEAVPPAAVPRDRPLALVLGAEESGVSAAVEAACRRAVRIPSVGRVHSLNIAQAAAVLLHALT
jgi:TrmH RNA methyltransferase